MNSCTGNKLTVFQMLRSEAVEGQKVVYYHMPQTEGNLVNSPTRRTMWRCQRVWQTALVLCSVYFVVVVQAYNGAGMGGTASEGDTKSYESGKFPHESRTIEEAMRRCDFDSFFTVHTRECEGVRRNQMDVLKDCCNEHFRREHLQVCETTEFYTQTQQARCIGDEVFATMEKVSCQNIKEHTMKLEDQCSTEKQLGRAHERMCEDNRIYVVQALEKLCGEATFVEENRSVCEGIKMSQEEQTRQCMKDGYFQRHELACENFFYYMWKGRQRCGSDEAYAAQHPIACSNQEYHTLQQQRMCTQDVEYKVKNDKACAENVHYYVRQQQEKCVNDIQYYEVQKENCNSQIRKAQWLQGNCDNVGYYSNHAAACDVERYYVQVQQQKCNDQTFNVQHEDVCEVQRTTTAAQQQTCSQEEYYVEHQKTCNDNQHYYVQMTQVKCHDKQYYWQNAQTCKDVQIVHNVRILEKCDNASYRMMHSQACAAQRYATQKQQTVCNEAGYVAKHSEVCGDVKTALKEQQARCSSTAYGAQHVQTCRDAQIARERPMALWQYEGRILPLSEGVPTDVRGINRLDSFDREAFDPLLGEATASLTQTVGGGDMGTRWEREQVGLTPFTQGMPVDRGRVTTPIEIITQNSKVPPIPRWDNIPFERSYVNQIGRNFIDRELAHSSAFGTPEVLPVGRVEVTPFERETIYREMMLRPRFPGVPFARPLMTPVARRVVYETPEGLPMGVSAFSPDFTRTGDATVLEFPNEQMLPFWDLLNTGEQNKLQTAANGNVRWQAVEL
eukprot:GHVS01065322.1.p1 GENE.GHVS01065322.1~~GHVS01065322.1.p1  ORF type:complete len:785 (-),score=89.69 GHVS01065322.1:226-2580(-)